MSPLKSAVTWSPRLARRASWMQASEIRELLKVIDQPGIISFAGGIPDPSLFPVETIRVAYAEILSDATSAGRALQYSVSEGDPCLRDLIVGQMSAKGVCCTRENILITNGSQQALEFLGRLFLSPGDTALVTAPTYLGALQAFAANEPRYHELELEDCNRTPASYEEAAAQSDGTCKFAYIVPDFANPSGETLSLTARKRLLQLAEDLDMVIVEDSPYAALRYEGEDITPIQSIDLGSGKSIEQSRVIFCGSFSKIFTPGLRTGWVCASSDIIRRLTLIKQASDLNAPAINQMVVARLASTLLDQQAMKVRESYRRKRDAMLRALHTHMPVGVSWTHPEGGMFIWASLPEAIDTTELLNAAVKEAKVAYVPGRAFFADGSGHNTMRFSFSLPDVGDIEAGIERLGHLVSDKVVCTSRTKKNRTFVRMPGLSREASARLWEI